MNSYPKDFFTRKNEEISLAAFLLAATLTSQKDIFAVPEFLTPSTSWEKLCDKIAEYATDWTPNKGVIFGLANSTIKALEGQGIPIIATQDDPYVIWAAFEFADALTRANPETAHETVFSYDIGDSALSNSDVDWDEDLIKEIIDAAIPVIEDTGFLSCRPFMSYTDGEDNNTPCYLCEGSCKRLAHHGCMLLAEIKKNTAGSKPEVPDKTIEQRDEELEKLWDELSDVPFDENEDGELVLTEDWYCFDAGTEREEIWHYFDKRHSKGVAYLLYGGNPAPTDTDKLVELDAMCFECDAEHCAFNPRGICKFPMVYGVLPEQTEKDGCLDFLLERDADNE